ncbi:MAG: HAMP domain-containing histidine kinase [Bacteroidales bacterium]|nr:HAMP domain-containing histidine kinase [Bacteroidales bacterium]
MDLKRRISYQWQLFFPLVLTLWAIIFGMTWWMVENEKKFREDSMKEQLGLINERILATYQSEQDPRSFIDFVCRYYKSNPNYDLLRVSVYQNGEQIRSWGEPIGLSETEAEVEHGVTRTPEVNRSPEDANAGDRYFFYDNRTSADGEVTVISILPFDQDIRNATAPRSSLYWIVIALAIGVTVLSYFSTRYFGRNIKILRTIADKAVTDPNFIPPMDYPHDELGDITRRIAQMYNERSAAMQRQKREHAVALHAIEEKAKAKRQLTNNINHELRTPIGVVKGYLDTILENPDMDDTSRTHFLRKASEHIDRLVNLIADVSAITRLEDGGELIATEELDYHDVVYTIANDVEESGALGSMTFSFDVPLDCKINGNYNLLSGMLINLVKNAGLHSKGTLCELVMVKEDDNFYHFEFRDNGTGVGEEHLPHLFDRFYRVDSGRSRKAGGTGLGLPIVRNTVIAHGGDIVVENRPEGGLVFKFTLPKFRTKH